MKSRFKQCEWKTGSSKSALQMTSIKENGKNIERCFMFRYFLSGNFWFILILDLREWQFSQVTQLKQILQIVGV